MENKTKQKAFHKTYVTKIHLANGVAMVKCHKQLLFFPSALGKSICSLTNLRANHFHVNY